MAIINGTPGNDTISGTSGDDVIRGGDGNDRLDGGPFLFPGTHDELYGEAGDDFLTIYPADGTAPIPWSLADGGAGFDTAVINFNNFGSALTYVHNISSANITCGRLAGTLVNIEAIIFVGGAADDHITGGIFADELWGAGGTDILAGGGGADTFRGSAIQLSGDTLTDFGADDRIVVNGASLAGFTASVAGNVLNFTGGSVTLGAVPAGRVVVRAADVGGVEIAFSTARAANDFNGDGRSDILWRDAGGQFGDWLANASGGFGYNAAAGLTGVANSWKIAATGDFNGDGRSDILWRDSGTGQFGDWLANASGGFAFNAAAGITPVPLDWKIAGTGDFNGDGRDDILWRSSSSGQFGTWLANASGAFAYNAAVGVVTVGLDWHIAGTGDFNGDGRDDILWRSDSGQFGSWLANASGGFAFNAAGGIIAVGNEWKIAGTGDFNGDGRDDILWRNSSTGQFGDWLANSSGGFAYNAAAGLTTVGLDWQVADLGDYNGDGRDDILWRSSSSGQFGDWLANASGGFAYNAAAGLIGVATTWQVQSQETLWV